MIDQFINKIFQIGFNKCGTTSIYNLFDQYIENKKLKCIHWDNNNLALTIHKNVLSNNNKNILGKYNDYDVITDMECATLDKIILAHKDYFKELDSCYPNSKFILNIRPFDKWIKSRLKHRHYVKDTYVLMYMSVYNFTTVNEVIELWEYHWNEHINSVINYFSNRDKDLLIFDIENDKLDRLINFLPSLKFSIQKLPHLHKS